jgi:hypothetical protein
LRRLFIVAIDQVIHQAEVNCSVLVTRRRLLQRLKQLGANQLTPIGLGYNILIVFFSSTFTSLVVHHGRNLRLLCDRAQVLNYLFYIGLR